MSRPKKAKSAIERIDTIRGHKIRRQIVQAAIEAQALGKLVSPGGLRRQLNVPIQLTSYHVKVLRDEGILKLEEMIPRRGAFEHLYSLNGDYLAEITDSIALDQIAELIDGFKPVNLEKVAEIIRSTGRPVEA